MSIIDSNILVTLGLGGSLMMLAKTIMASLWGVFVKQISTTLTENNENAVMMTVINTWITKHNIANRIKSYRLAGETIAPGSYWVKLSWNSVCHIQYKVEKRDGWSSMYEIYELTFYGMNQEKILNELFEIRDLIDDSKSIKVYKANSMYSYVKHTKRSFDSIFLDGDILNNIKEQLDLWKSNKLTYATKGIIYKIGFCFYGPPGTGKTTLAKAIASYMDMDLRSIKLDAETNNIFRSSTGNAVYLFDDVDEYINALSAPNAQSTYDQLLSFIDGTDSPQNAIFIFNTNKYDTLPDAMKRSGRMDHKYYIGPVSRDTASLMCSAYGLQPNTIKSILHDGNQFLPCDLQLQLLEHINGKST
jgi:chaperone BCS1